jgi:hypothetical protein
MRASFLAVVLLAGCSSRFDVEEGPNPHTWDDPTTLTVCVEEGQTAERLSHYVIWAVNYWYSYGEQVEYVDHPYCLVRVSVSSRSKAPTGWGEGEIAQEMHRTSGIDAWAPATITQRKSFWGKASDPWRYQSMAHELGHALGHDHSEIMPMRSCDEHCYGEREVQAWYKGIGAGQ